MVIKLTCVATPGLDDPRAALQDVMSPDQRFLQYRAVALHMRESLVMTATDAGEGTRTHLDSWRGLHCTDMCLASIC